LSEEHGLIADLSATGLPFGGSSEVNTIISLLMYASFIVLMVFGQKIQSRLMLWEVEGAVKRLEYMRNEARALALKTISDIGKSKEDIAPELNVLLEQFLISPEGMDPAGIVWKLDHLLDVRDLRFKDDIRRVAPEATEDQVNNLENLVEASTAMNTIYRIVRHFYLLGKKTSSFYIIFQIQMILPLILQEASALTAAAKAFAQGQPIGDGAGALVAASLMRGREKQKIEKDIVMAETVIEGRRVISLKAEGPGGNVGKPGDAIRRIIEDSGGKVALVVMVDAALKLEGDTSGDISEGIGAAIGGPGTERFKIEEEVVKRKIPVHAIIIKESIVEAIAPMKKEISEAADKVIARIKKLIVERTKEGDTIIVAGIGNTVGIGQ
jgi:hypothetical protein